MESVAKRGFLGKRSSSMFALNEKFKRGNASMR
jgi:hypothetical protein